MVVRAVDVVPYARHRGHQAKANLMGDTLQAILGNLGAKSSSRCCCFRFLITPATADMSSPALRALLDSHSSSYALTRWLRAISLAEAEEASPTSRPHVSTKSTISSTTIVHRRGGSLSQFIIA